MIARLTQHMYQRLTPAIMSKSTVPSRALLSIFSRCLRNEKSLSFTRQCHQFSTNPSTTLPRSQQCLRSTPKPSLPIRQFSTSSPRTYKTVQEQRSRYRSGVCLSATPVSRIPKLTTLFTALLLESRPPLPHLRRRADLLFPI